MKKNVKIIVLFLFVFAVGALIFVNRNTNTEREKLARTKQLQIEYKGEEPVYEYREEGDKYITFDTEMRRRNGDVFSKNYSGIQLADIFDAEKIQLAPGDKVYVVCADNYRIELSEEEIETEGNIYLVTKESAQPLAESDGPFMLVVNNDEFSTRWAKNVVKIRVE